MSASATAPWIVPTRWTKRSERSTAHAEPSGEERWARLLRRLADRRNLREMDARLLRDVGLTREDGQRRMPFRTGTPCPAGRPGHRAAVRRTVRTVLVEPGREPVAGIAVLASPPDADLPAARLVLAACRWEETVSRRCALLLPIADGPVHRLSDHGLGLAEPRLSAHEGQAWQRHVARPASRTLGAYLAEGCV